MAVNILRGPAGAGKSQWFDANAEPGSLWLDLTAIWASIRGLERGPDGRYPVRLDDGQGLRMAAYLKSTGIAFAERENLNGWTTTSSSAPESIERLRARGASGVVRTIDPGEQVVRRRLTDPITGELDPECDRALLRWYSI